MSHSSASQSINVHGPALLAPVHLNLLTIETRLIPESGSFIFIPYGNICDTMKNYCVVNVHARIRNNQNAARLPQVKQELITNVFTTWFEKNSLGSPLKIESQLIFLTISRKLSRHMKQLFFPYKFHWF